MRCIIVQLLSLITISASLNPFNLDFADGINLKLEFPPSKLLVNFYETFPPFDDVVIQNFHFLTDRPLIVNLHDRFCTGNSFRAYDNFKIVINEESILNFCGISANNLVPIVNPDFKEVEFPLDAGEHYLTIVVLHSPIGSQRTSLRITLKPVDGDVCNVVVSGMETKCYGLPTHNWSIKNFDIHSYRNTGKLTT